MAASTVPSTSNASTPDPLPPPPALDPREPLPPAQIQVQPHLSPNPNSRSRRSTSAQRSGPSAPTTPTTSHIPTKRESGLRSRTRTPDQSPFQSRGTSPAPGGHPSPFEPSSGLDTLLEGLPSRSSDLPGQSSHPYTFRDRGREDSDDPLRLFERDVESLLSCEGVSSGLRPGSRSMSPIAQLATSGTVNMTPFGADQGQGRASRAGSRSGLITHHPQPRYLVSPSPSSTGHAGHTLGMGLASALSPATSARSSRASSPVRSASAIFERDIESPFSSMGLGAGTGDLLNVNPDGNGYKTPNGRNASGPGRRIASARGSFNNGPGGSPPKSHQAGSSAVEMDRRASSQHHLNHHHDMSDARVPTVLDEAIEALQAGGLIEVESPVPGHVGAFGGGRTDRQHEGYEEDYGKAFVRSSVDPLGGDSAGVGPRDVDRVEETGGAEVIGRLRGLLAGRKLTSAGDTSSGIEGNSASVPTSASTGDSRARHPPRSPSSRLGFMRPAFLDRTSTGPVLPGGFPSSTSGACADTIDLTEDGDVGQNVVVLTGGRPWRKRLEDLIGPKPTALFGSGDEISDQAENNQGVMENGTHDEDRGGVDQIDCLKESVAGPAFRNNAYLDGPKETGVDGPGRQERVSTTAWPDTRVLELLGVRVPILQAPMANSNFAPLAIAVATAGGLGAIACASLSPDRVREEVAAFRAATDAPLNLNFFVYEEEPVDPAVDKAWAQRVSSLEHMEAGARSGGAGGRRAPFNKDTLSLVEELRPEVVSFHFGLPAPWMVDRLHSMGARILSSATTVAEAHWLVERGCDAVIAQGIEAGGHRGSFLVEKGASVRDTIQQVGTMALVPQVVDAVTVPVIAAGGIADGRGVAAALTLGASAVQIGTAYLFCAESAISNIHREALATVADNDTRVTLALTGRPARGIINRAMRELDPHTDGAPPFPRAAEALSVLRAKAESAGRGDYSPMWAGQAAPITRRFLGGRDKLSATEFTRMLAEDAAQRLGLGRNGHEALLSPPVTTPGSSPPILSPHDIKSNQNRVFFPLSAAPVSSPDSPTHGDCANASISSSLIPESTGSATKKRRISFVSYNDMLHSLPVQVNPLKDIVAGGKEPDHLPGTISPRGSGSRTRETSSNPTGQTEQGAGSRSISTRRADRDKGPRARSPLNSFGSAVSGSPPAARLIASATTSPSVSRPSSRRASLSPSTSPGISRPGSQDGRPFLGGGLDASPFSFSDMGSGGGEADGKDANPRLGGTISPGFSVESGWEREGLGKGLEARLEELALGVGPVER